MLPLPSIAMGLVIIALTARMRGYDVLADPAGWVLKGKIVTEWDSFALDATTFSHRGRRYLVWAQGEPEIGENRTSS